MGLSRYTIYYTTLLDWLHVNGAGIRFYKHMMIDGGKKVRQFQ